jgi:hypothetical protein
MEGWVFDKRDDIEMTRVISFEPSPENRTNFFNGGNGTGWSPDFVRGVAVGIEGVTEISFNERSRIISFESAAADGVRINVYYTTRTIGTALTHPSQGATQLFRRNCTNEELVNIFENPRVHTGRGYKRRRIDSSVSEIIQTPYGRGLVEDKEAEVRNALMELDSDIVAINEKRQRLLKRIRDADLSRAKDAKAMKSKIATRKEECSERKRIRQEQLEAQKQKERKARELRNRTCPVCSRTFLNAHAKRQHYNAVHV